MQSTDSIGIQLVEPVAQQLGKQRMIAVPVTLIVEGGDEQVGLFQIRQSRLRRGSVAGRGRRGQVATAGGRLAAATRARPSASRQSSLRCADPARPPQLLLSPDRSFAPETGRSLPQ